jgi:membrane protein implicated in regulation of membrane protease activity
MSWLTPLAWFIIAMILMLLELAVPGVLLVFFGVGALVTSLLSWLGVLQNTTAELLVFLFVSVVSLLLLRNKMQKTFRGKTKQVKDPDADLEEFIGKTARVVEAINPSDLRGKVEFRGANWEAQAEVPIEPGIAVEIISRKNLMLIVKPKREA